MGATWVLASAQAPWDFPRQGAQELRRWLFPLLATLSSVEASMGHLMVTVQAGQVTTLPSHTPLLPPQTWPVCLHP